MKFHRRHRNVETTSTRVRAAFPRAQRPSRPRSANVLVWPRRIRKVAEAGWPEGVCIQERNDTSQSGPRAAWRVELPFPSAALHVVSVPSHSSPTLEAPLPAAPDASVTRQRSHHAPHAPASSLISDCDVAALSPVLHGTGFASWGWLARPPSRSRPDTPRLIAESKGACLQSPPASLLPRRHAATPGRAPHVSRLAVSCCACDGQISDPRSCPLGAHLEAGCGRWGRGRVLAPRQMMAERGVCRGVLGANASAGRAGLVPCPISWLLCVGGGVRNWAVGSSRRGIFGGWTCCCLLAW